MTYAINGFEPVDYEALRRDTARYLSNLIGEESTMTIFGVTDYQELSKIMGLATSDTREEATLFNTRVRRAPIVLGDRFGGDRY